MAGRPAIEAIHLARELIRCPSITPNDAGALDHLRAVLTDLGFVCHRLRFEEPASEPVDNLYARFGDGAPNFCFAGHTDVVPVGDRDAWSVDPFAAEIRDGALYGRGASDMKGAIAAFVAAADGFLADRDENFSGSISLLITGDEEGPAVNGTIKVLDWMAARGERIDACLVGEPTNPTRLGEMVKVGRRGSLSADITVYGTQGHVAYPDLADNPIPRLIAILDRLNGRALDQGNDDFQPSNLEITSVDVGNEAANVIPATASARLNIRFNTEQSAEGLGGWLRETCAELGGRHEVRIHCNSHPFLTPPGRLCDVIVAAVEEVLGERPALSTTGGTSDARFIKDHCPVVEFGLVGRTMHKIDEQVRTKDIEALSRIYHAVLRRYFSR